MGSPGPCPSPVCPRIIPEPSSFTHVPESGSNGFGAHDHRTAPGTAPTHVAIPRPRLRFSDRSPTHRVFVRPSVIADGGTKLPRKKTPSPFTPGSPTPKTPT